MKYLIRTLSYCCKKNVPSIIKQHNANILSAKSNKKRGCNCRNKACCPLEGHSLTECIVYEAKVSMEDNFELYYGTCEEEFKSHFITTQNNFEIGVMKRSFKRTF